MEIVDPNATILPMQSKPVIDSPGIGMQSVDTEFIFSVFDIQTAANWDQRQHSTDILQ